MYTSSHHFRTVWNLGIQCKTSPLHSLASQRLSTLILYREDSPEQVTVRTGVRAAHRLQPKSPKSCTAVLPVTTPSVC